LPSSDGAVAPQLPQPIPRRVRREAEELRAARVNSSIRLLQQASPDNPPNLPTQHFVDLFVCFSEQQIADNAKARPGSATVGAGSIGHLAIELLWKQAGVQLVHVPYRGGAPASNDPIAGHVDLMIASTAQLIPQIQARLIRAVAQTGKTHLDARGRADDRRELCLVRGLCLVGPIRVAASLPEPCVTTQLSETQQVTLALGGPEERRKFLAEQMRSWGAVARENQAAGRMATPADIRETWWSREGFEPPDLLIANNEALSH
jgi:hypothetical protein